MHVPENYKERNGRYKVQLNVTSARGSGENRIEMKKGMWDS